MTPIAKWYDGTMNRALFLGISSLALLSGSILGAAGAQAKTTAAPFEISGWIPYWREATGTVDTLSHLQAFSAVMPFGYIVQNDGSLYDAFGLAATSSASTARLLVAVARAEGVKVVPTVMWSNSAAIDRILRAAPRRRALEADIVALVKEQGFDGINIDFENKMAKTRPYFSLFLQGLYARMGKKLVYCSIEPRTPPLSAFAVVPRKLEYANDYAAINRYCDRVDIMAYDQGAVDLTLNAAASPTPYIPVADAKWAEKVIALAAKTISKKKIILGVATYGYEYDLVPLLRGYRYVLNWTFNPGYATALASELGITPARNAAGEMSFIYAPTTTPQLASAVPDPARIVWWSDAGAIGDKIRLAKKLGIRGIALFKLDGGEDPGLWDVLSAK